jgi:hypothetical protein
LAQNEKEEQMKDGKIARFAGAVWIATILFVFYSVHVIGAELSSTATVKDTKGKAYKVVSLYARYTAEGGWIGSRPKHTEASLLISLYTTKDRVTTEEKIEFDFKKVRRFIFKNADVPNELQRAFAADAGEPMRIELRDGTVILLGRKVLIEIGAGGKQTKRIDFDNRIFKAGETQDNSITFDSFQGRARTEDGKEGDFHIGLDETASIDFE